MNPNRRSSHIPGAHKNLGVTALRASKPNGHILGQARCGVTLLELMIAMALVTIGVVGMMGSFKYIQQAIQASKNRTLASNLAQEKMQILKQKNYYQVLVTSDPAHNTTDFAPESIDYDTGYFPPEDVKAGVVYKLYTLVQVAREDSGTIVILSPATPDTGLRLITITVVWSQGGVKRKLRLRSLLANPDTVMANAVFNGLVRNSVTMVGINGALVNAAENMGWRDTTDAAGAYSISLSPGSFTLVASANGYYTELRTVSITANATQTQDFNLVKIATGTVTGYPWLTDHLVISQIVGSTVNTSGYDQEYVEIFNPTTFTWTVNGAIGLKFQRPIVNDPVKRTIQINYLTASIPSRGFYLFSNVNTVTAGGASITADAVWANTNPVADFPYFGTQNNIIPVSDQGGGEGGGALELYRTSDGSRVDAVGWDKNDAAKAAPFSETEGYEQAIGLERTELYSRKSSTSGISSFYGPAYDSGNNDKDIGGNKPLNIAPRNSLSTVQPVISGTPAAGAVISCSDGLSSSAEAALYGAPPYAYFSLVDVATGTWTVFITSGSYGIQNDTVTIPASGSVYTFSSTTTFLTQEFTQGIITGKVLNAFGTAISAPSAIVLSPGGAGDNTSANASTGRYTLRVASGPVDVTANPGNANPDYVSISSLTIPVETGQVRSGVDFILYQGARISGFVTRDGINALPGVVVSVTDISGVSYDQPISGVDGRFTTISVPTGTYTAEPALDSLEQAVPSSTTVILTAAGVTQFSSTFTITGALGYITGTVKYGGELIKTGVLIVVTTTTLVGTPPAPPALSTATLAGAPFYVVSSLEDGTYSVAARQATAPKYNVYAYYPSPSGSVATIVSSAAANIQVLAGQTTTGVNFSW